MVEFLALLEPASHIETPSIRVVAAAVAGLYLGYCIWIGIYNLYFHPLSKFPGPKLAAVSNFYEFWYEVVRDGTFLWEIEKMHAKYGPIVRITPGEIHIKDSSYYGNIYTGSSRKVNKDPNHTGAFDVPSATAATIDHNLHRARRSYLSPYFSKRAIFELEPVIHERVDKLLERFDDAMREGSVMNLDGAFSALTADVITLRFYGKHFDYLGIKDFRFVVRDGFQGLTSIYNLARFIPVIINVLKSLPTPVIRMIIPCVADLLTMRDQIKHTSVGTLQRESTTKSKSVIVGALGDHSIPAHERTVSRLVDEGTVILFAGTETTSRSLAVIMYYLLQHPAVLKKLREELDTLPPKADSVYSLTQLEPLPYLTAVIHEGLRLAFGPITPTPRIATDEVLEYNGYFIPAGTPVSQSTYFLHTDEEIFPNAWNFDPERWIRAQKEGIRLDKYLANFTKGARQCIGISMTFAELYLTLPRIVRGFDMELYNTTAADVEVYHARIIGYSKISNTKAAGAGEIEVKITGKPKLAIA